MSLRYDALKLHKDNQETEGQHRLRVRDYRIFRKTY